MSTPDLGALLRQAQEMQKRIAELQRELARRSVSRAAPAAAGHRDGLGRAARPRGRDRPALLAGGDRAMLQDLVAAAVNAALASAQRMVQEEMQRAAGGAVPQARSRPGFQRLSRTASSDC